MVRARGHSPLVTRMALSDAEARTIEMLAQGKAQKEIAHEDRVTEACISERLKRAMERNGFANKHLFIAECLRLCRTPGG